MSLPAPRRDKWGRFRPGSIRSEFSPYEILDTVEFRIDELFSVDSSNYVEDDRGDNGTWHVYRFDFVEPVPTYLAGHLAKRIRDEFTTWYHDQARFRLVTERLDEKGRLSEGTFTPTSAAKTSAAFNAVASRVQRFRPEASGQYDRLIAIEVELRVPSWWES